MLVYSLIGNLVVKSDKPWRIGKRKFSFLYVYNKLRKGRREYGSIWYACIKNKIFIWYREKKKFLIDLKTYEGIFLVVKTPDGCSFFRLWHQLPGSCWGKKCRKRRILVRGFYCLWVDAGVDLASVNGFCVVGRWYFGTSVYFVI